MEINERTLLPQEEVKPIATMQMEFDIDFFINIDTPLKNPLHEKFAQYIMQGKSATEAYFWARKDCGKKEINRKSCTEKGSRLLADGDIVNRIKFLHKAVIQQIIMSDIELYKHLTDIIRSTKEKTADRINAIKVLAQIKGLAKEEQSQTSQHFVNLQVEVVDGKAEPIKVIEGKNG